MDNFEQGPEQPKISSLAEVPAIQESRNQMIATRDQIVGLVEQPLLDACVDMWDKNVRTLSTSANRKDIEAGEAYIIIDFDSLSEENKKAAQQLADPIDYDGVKAIKIPIPVSETTTTDEISQRAAEIAGTFKKQPATWIPKYTLEYLKKAYGIAPEETDYDDPSVWEGYYYDSKEKVFYMSEEHYQKANEEIDAK
ncbi:MAG: hypothetical protein Q8P91_00550 [bacterium]|nr:hypothetical protein [bacterium]